MKSIKVFSALVALLLFTSFNSWSQTKTKSDFLGRIDPDNAVLLLIDHQTNLILGCQSMEPILLKNNTVALAAMAKIFKLPIVLTTTGGGGNGPAGPLFPELLAELPGQEVIDRQQFYNSMDDAKFKAAVEKTGRKKLIIAGITSDLCVMFPALTALSQGYDVYIVTDACASWSKEVDIAAINRLSQAGCILTNINGLYAELQNNLTMKDTERAKALQFEGIKFFGRFVGPLSLMNGTFFKDGLKWSEKK
jgi:nicotinamidase-related amidase